MYYIAYGSNLNLEQMKYRCPNSKPIGTGYIRDYKLVFNYHADIIESEDDDIVPVLLWDIAEEDWASLDRYEGYPRYYVKEKIWVRMDNGELVEGVAYVMAKNRKGFELPNWEYFNIILEGYRENDMDEKYLDEALVYTEEKTKERDNVIE